MSNLKSRADYVYTTIPDAYIVDGDTLPTREPLTRRGVTLRAEDLALLHEMVIERLHVVSVWAGTSIEVFPSPNPRIDASQIIGLIDKLLKFMPDDPENWAGALITDKRPNFPASAGAIKWWCQDTVTTQGSKTSREYKCAEMKRTVAEELYGAFEYETIIKDAIARFSASGRGQLISIKKKLEKHVEENVPLNESTISKLLTTVSKLNYIWGYARNIVDDNVATIDGAAWPCATCIPSLSKKEAFAMQKDGEDPRGYFCADLLFEEGYAPYSIIEESGKIVPSDATTIFWRHGTLSGPAPGLSNSFHYRNSHYLYETNGQNNYGGSYSEYSENQNERGLYVKGSGGLEVYITGVKKIKTLGGKYISNIKSISLCVMNFEAECTNKTIIDTTYPCEDKPTIVKETRVDASCKVTSVKTLDFDTVRSTPGGGDNVYTLNCSSADGGSLAERLEGGGDEPVNDYNKTPPEDTEEECQEGFQHDEFTETLKHKWIKLADWAIIELDPHALPED